jgi:hypothetical protein
VQAVVLTGRARQRRSIRRVPGLVLLQVGAEGEGPFRERLDRHAWTGGHDPSPLETVGGEHLLDDVPELPLLQAPQPVRVQTLFFDSSMGHAFEHSGSLEERG